MISTAAEMQFCQLVSEDPHLTPVAKSPDAQAEDDTQEDEPQRDERTVVDEDPPRSQCEAEL